MKAKNKTIQGLVKELSGYNVPELESKIGSLKVQVGVVSETLAKAGESLTEAQDRVSAYRPEYNKLNDRKLALEGLLKSATAAVLIDHYTAELNALKPQWSELKLKLQTAVATVSVRSAKLKAETEKLAPEQAALQTELSANETKLNTAKGLDLEIKLMEVDIMKLELKITNLK